MWSPNDKKMILMPYKDAKKQFIKKNIKNGNFNLYSWFFDEEYTLYKQTVKINKPKILTENGTNYINQF